MAMDSRTQFLLQLLHKLGAPLMGAVSAHSSPEATGEKDAATLAALLSESVKTGITLSQSMNLKTDDGDADAIRVCLATLAGGLISGSYEQTGRVPTDAESQRIVKALQAVIVFADNFAPAAEHAQRLKTLDGTPPFFDPVQTNIYAMHALLPAISAISEFSFGQSETKLIQDVADRLGRAAKDMQAWLGTSQNPMGELVILEALGRLYAAAHRGETKRLKSSGSDASATIDPVWIAFEKQRTMLEVVAKSMGSGAGGTTVSQSSGSSSVKPEASAPPVETSPQAPATPPPVAAPPAAADSAPPPAAPPAGAAVNPMSFFKKK